MTLWHWSQTTRVLRRRVTIFAAQGGQTAHEPFQIEFEGCEGLTGGIVQFTPDSAALLVLQAH